MNATITSRSGQAPPGQLTRTPCGGSQSCGAALHFPFERLRARVLIRRHARKLSAVRLAALDPSRPGLRGRPDLRGNRRDGRPLRGMLLYMLAHHPNGPIRTSGESHARLLMAPAAHTLKFFAKPERFTVGAALLLESNTNDAAASSSAAAIQAQVDTALTANELLFSVRKVNSAGRVFIVDCVGDVLTTSIHPSSTLNHAAMALSSVGATVTVTTGSLCVCNNSTTVATPSKVDVSSTTVRIANGAGIDTVNYVCL